MWLVVDPQKLNVRITGNHALTSTLDLVGLKLGATGVILIHTALDVALIIEPQLKRGR